MRFHKILFKQLLKVSAFYLEKQKSFIPKNKFLGRCQYQNKKALFTDPIFSRGFAPDVCHFTSVNPIGMYRFFSLIFLQSATASKIQVFHLHFP